MTSSVSLILRYISLEKLCVRFVLYNEQDYRQMEKRRNLITARQRKTWGIILKRVRTTVGRDGEDWRGLTVSNKFTEKIFQDVRIACNFLRLIKNK